MKDFSLRVLDYYYTTMLNCLSPVDFRCQTLLSSDIALHFLPKFIHFSISVFGRVKEFSYRFIIIIRLILAVFGFLLSLCRSR